MLAPWKGSWGDMKRPIAWHEECLVNMRASLAQEETRLARLNAEAARSRDHIATLAAQIDEAKRRGLTEFDAERLLKRRRAA